MKMLNLMYTFLCFFVIFVVFYSDQDDNTMLTAVPLFFDIFTYCVCLFCSRIGDNIMEFESVIQMRGLAGYKTRFNPPFSTFENACTKSGI